MDAADLNWEPADRGEFSGECLVLRQLYLLHHQAARKGDDARRERLFKMVDDFEWAFPDAAAEFSKSCTPDREG